VTRWTRLEHLWDSVTKKASATRYAANPKKRYKIGDGRSLLNVQTPVARYSTVSSGGPRLVSRIVLRMTATQAPWFSALAPYVERDDLVVELANPFLRPTGERVDMLPSVFMRFPMWRGSPFVDDLGKKSAAMIDLDGEHLFAELAILRLLEREGWEGRWIHTTSKGEISTYLTEWRDVARQEQRSRGIQHDGARAMLYAIADRSGNRYGGCWSVFAWRETSYVFFEARRQAAKDKEQLKPAQAAWVRAALSLRQQIMSPRDFAFVQWDYKTGD